jgi:hypothetical protein
MGYSFTWKDIQKICTGLGMERQGKTNIWKGVGATALNAQPLYTPTTKGHWDQDWPVGLQKNN